MNGEKMSSMPVKSIINQRYYCQRHFYKQCINGEFVAARPARRLNEFITFVNKSFSIWYGRLVTQWTMARSSLPAVFMPSLAENPLRDVSIRHRLYSISATENARRWPNAVWMLTQNLVNVSCSSCCHFEAAHNQPQRSPPRSITVVIIPENVTN